MVAPGKGATSVRGRRAMAAASSAVTVLRSVAWSRVSGPGQAASAASSPVLTAVKVAASQAGAQASSTPPSGRSRTQLPR